MNYFLGCFGPQVTLEELCADEGNHEGPTGLDVGGVGSVPCSPFGKEEAVLGADAAGGIIFTACSQGLSSPALSGRFRNQF